MTEEQHTEVNETEGGSTSDESGSDQDSPVIQQLRKQLKETQKELKSVPSRSDIEAEVRASLARETAIEQQLVALKQPAGLRPLIDEKLGEKEATPENVVESLKAIGFELSDSAEGGEESQQGQQTAEDLAQVANLGNQVANAANQQTGNKLDEKIANAETPAELAQIMREAGQAQ